jgi:hypothetical protein
VAALNTLKLGGRVLVVLADEETVARRSFANLPNAHTASFGELSAHDVLRSDWILFSDRTLPGSPGDFSTGLADVEGTGDDVGDADGTAEQAGGTTEQADDTTEEATDA